MNLEQVYPSIGEILPTTILDRMPYTLVEEIQHRYSELGGKYMTDEKTEDGRFINACMNKSSVQDAIEEVIDAVFNMSVALFKLREQSDNLLELGNPSGPMAADALVGLMEIYSMLRLLQVEFNG